jgi:hypothetical protein
LNVRCSAAANDRLRGAAGLPSALHNHASGGRIRAVSEGEFSDTACVISERGRVQRTPASGLCRVAQNDAISGRADESGIVGPLGLWRLVIDNPDAPRPAVGARCIGFRRPVILLPPDAPAVACGLGGPLQALQAPFEIRRHRRHPTRWLPQCRR